MKKLSLALALIFSTSTAVAANCEISWNPNPTEEEITHYSLYDGSTVVVPEIPGVTYTLPCAVGAYSVTASNKYGIESERSSSIVVGQPVSPKNIIINITIN